MVNKAILEGHVGKDPVVRESKDGKKWAAFSLATNESFRNKSGERQQVTDWHNVVCFNEPLTKVIEQYVKKGSHIYVEGQVKTRKWEDKDGSTKYTTEIVMAAFRSSLVLLDKAEGGNRAPDPDGEGSYGTAKPLSEHYQEQERREQSGARTQSLHDFDDESSPF